MKEKDRQTTNYKTQNMGLNTQANANAFMLTLSIIVEYKEKD